MSPITRQLSKVVFLMILLCAGINAQFTQTPLIQHGNTLNKSDLSGDELNDKNNFIKSGEAVVVRAQIFNNNKYPIIVTATFTNQLGADTLSYPVAMIDKRKSEDNLIIYGPLSYDGREAMNLRLDVYEFREDYFNSIKGEYDKRKDLLQLIPAVSQFSQFIDMGWQITEKFFKNRINTTNISIKRETALPLRTRNLWYVAADKEAQKEIGAVLDQNINIDSANNDFPRFNSLKNGVAMVVNVRSELRAAALTDIANRIDGFLKKREDYLKEKGLEFDNPFSSEKNKPESLQNFNQYIETYSSENELARSREVAQSSFFGLMEKFNADLANNEFSENTDKVISSFIAKRLGYEDGTRSETNNLGSIGLWYKWMRSRCDGIESKDYVFKNGTFLPVTSSAGGETYDEGGVKKAVDNQKDIKIAQYGCKDASTFKFEPYDPASKGKKLITVKNTYALGYIDKTLGTYNIKKSDPLDVQFAELAKKNENLKTLVSNVFQPGDDAPWLLSEQSAVAKWLKTNIKDFSKVEFQPGAKMIKIYNDLISGDKVLVNVSDDGKTIDWELKSKSDYVYDLYEDALKDVADPKNAKNYPNPYAEIRKQYQRIIIFPVEQKLLPENEIKLLTSKVGGLFNGMGDISTDAAAKYFDANVLFAELDANKRVKIKAVDGAKTTLDFIAKAKVLYTTEKADEAGRYTNGKDDLTRWRRESLYRVALQINPAGDASLNGLILNYLKSKVTDRQLDAVKTSDAVNYQTVRNAAMGALDPTNSNLVWNENSGKFINGGVTLSNQVLAFEQNLRSGCEEVDRSDREAIKECVIEPDNNGVSAISNIENLYKIVCERRDATAVREALRVIRDFVQIEGNVLNGLNAAQSCTLLNAEYPTGLNTQHPNGNLEWSQGMFKVKKADAAVPVTKPRDVAPGNQ